MRWFVAVGCAALVAVGVSACDPTSPYPGNDETDRIASVVSEAMSYPRQISAEAYARAAIATRAGQDGRLRVIEARDTGGPTRPVARLVYLVHLDATGDGLGSSAAVDACYDVDFTADGIVDDASRRDCPPNPVALSPTPIAPTPKAVVVAGSDDQLEHVLRVLPSSPPSSAAVERAVSAALPKPTRIEGVKSLRDLPPTVTARTDGADVGVAVWAAPDRTCVLGARIDGVVQVWRPSAVQLSPGELTCDAGTALGRGGIRPPH